MSEPTEKPKSKRGRPPALQADEETLDTLRKLGRIQATQEEAAAFLEVSRKTFTDFLRKNKKARDAMEMGAQQGKISLRRRQFQAADSGNTTMLVWLGKQHLGQKDKHEHSGDEKNPIKHEHKLDEFSSRIARIASRGTATERTGGT